MAECRAIVVDGFNPLERRPDPGAAPMLQWLPIAQLVVDPSYQRDVGLSGRKNIRRIAENFSWSKFGTVIVAPIVGGLYAIVDGQHRTTAAMLAGIEQVPCQAIVATPAEQAAAFKAINGTLTRMTRLQIHAAALAAGDDTANAVADVCARADVTILRSKPSWDNMKPGQTVAVDVIAKCLQQYGRDVIVSALQCVTQTANGGVAGLLRAQIIRALCIVLAARPAALDAGEALLSAFDQIDIESDFEAMQHVPRRNGTSLISALADRIGIDLDSILAARR